MRHITNCFNRDLSKLRKQAIELEQIQKLILDYIPAEVKPHCQVGSFANGCLILTVNDAIWASQLRFMLPEIRDNLRKDAQLYQLINIKVNINRDLLKKDMQKIKPKTIKTSPWKGVLEQLKAADN